MSGTEAAPTVNKKQKRHRKGRSKRALFVLMGARPINYFTNPTKSGGKPPPRKKPAN